MTFDENRLIDLTDRAFENSSENTLWETQALVVSLHGEVVLERYSDGLDARSTFLSWSMAKSVASALCGVLVGRSLLDLDAPAPVRAWHVDEHDPRRSITLKHLLQMRSGLEWIEDYVDEGVSDVIEMLFGAGQSDVAAHAANKPLGHRPGQHWYYSSGTTNIVTSVMGDAIGAGRDGFTQTLVDELLAPAGMSNVSLRFDDADTWIGSSFLYATARDYLAFGELFRHDGCVGGPSGSRLLPEGWVEASTHDHATCPETGQGYGLQWWLTRDSHGSFSANGYEGQRLQVSPDLGLTFVRLGKTPAEHGEDLRSFYSEVVDCFGS